MSVNYLSPLTDIYNTISAPALIRYTDIDDLRESICLIIDDFITNNIKEYKYMDFNERVFDYTYKICECLYDNLDCFIDINLDELIHDSICSYFELCGTKRSEVSKVATPKNKRVCSKILKNIKIKDTHEQGTAEWFDFRWNHITASSAWKAFEENASKNQLILSKCQPINPSKYTNVNITSATHHGHKYEPVSILIYEEQYDTEIGEYGCIESDRFSYLAASPDGINTKIDNCRYGRLLEVKNHVLHCVCRAWHVGSVRGSRTPYIVVHDSKKTVNRVKKKKLYSPACRWQCPNSRSHRSMRLCRNAAVY